MDNDEEYPEPGDIEVCPICERENRPDEYDMCVHHWAARVDGEIQSNDPKFLEFCSSWEAALKTMSEALDLIEKRSERCFQLNQCGGTCFKFCQPLNHDLEPPITILTMMTGFTPH
jgi:hypothetical protein